MNLKLHAEGQGQYEKEILKKIVEKEIENSILRKFIFFFTRLKIKWSTYYNLYILGKLN